MGQRHRDTETQRHRDTETQRHRDTGAQRNVFTIWSKVNIVTHTSLVLYHSDGLPITKDCFFLSRQMSFPFWKTYFRIKKILFFSKRDTTTEKKRDTDKQRRGDTNRNQNPRRIQNQRCL